MVEPLQLGASQILGLQIGGSAVVGGLIGYFAKKVAKVIALLVGAELVLFKFLETQGIVAVDWGKLSAGLVSFSQETAFQTQGLVETIISTAGIGAGFAGGFALGFKRA